MQSPISITAISSVSVLGSSLQESWQSYQDSLSLFTKKDQRWISEVAPSIEASLTTVQQENSTYKKLDRAVLLALLTAKQLRYNFDENRVGINIGSSRGATSLFERYHHQFLKTKKVSPFSSPTTTLGNISSWVGQELGIEGIQIDHSVTCSTAMHALLNGVAWLSSGMADMFLVGGSEAPLTPFTIAQMEAMQLYSQSKDSQACKSMLFDKKENTMVLGEGASIAVLERGVSSRAKAVVKGVGFASEILIHNSSISEDADCFQKSMRMALENANIDTVDVVIMHAPGTIKGDRAEKNAIDIIFSSHTPLLTSNKWLLGHTLGASGMMSVEMAILMLQHDCFIENPLYPYSEEMKKKPIQHIMINAVGFGGNAVSIVLSKPVYLSSTLNKK